MRHKGGSGVSEAHAVLLYPRGRCFNNASISTSFFMTTQRVLLSFFFFFFLGGLNSHVFKIGCSSKPLRSNQALNVSIKNPIKIDFSIYRLFDEIDFSIIKNLPGNSTVGNFGQLRADGQLGADGQLHIIFEQVQNRFHWDKALGGRLF